MAHCFAESKDKSLIIFRTRIQHNKVLCVLEESLAEQCFELFAEIAEKKDIDADHWLMTTRYALLSIVSFLVELHVHGTLDDARRQKNNLQPHLCSASLARGQSPHQAPR